LFYGIDGEELMAENIIFTEKLTKKFDKFIAADSLTFNVVKGEIFGFLGANGAGKTTAIRMLCGLSKPTSGTAAIAGFDIYRDTEFIKKSIGYMSQKFSLYNDLTILENINFFGGIYGLSKSELKLKSTELIEKLNFVDQSNQLVSSLPLGWKQKLAFLTSIVHNPRIIFLDEPTGGVDPITRRQFWDLIYEASENGITVFITTHYMDEAEYCDRVSIMVDGEIAAIDSPSNMKNQYNVSTMNEVFVKIARKSSRLI
jgi:ABC-2 type transport system ATP-binding protein